MLTFVIKLLLDALKCAVDQVVVQFVTVMVVHSEDRRDQSLLMLPQDDAVLGQVPEEDSFAESYRTACFIIDRLLAAFDCAGSYASDCLCMRSSGSKSLLSFVFDEFLVGFRNFVEETITVN